MTIETRATIQLGDVLAVEYECRECKAKIVRPIVAERTNAVPTQCGNCGAVWIEGTQARQNLADMLNLIALLRDQNGSRFTLRFEVAGLADPRK
jgi:transcription elongation factor Elf1